METCRTCAKCDLFAENDLIPIFESSVWLTQLKQICREFLETWNLQIAPNDGLPQSMCKDCFQQFQLLCKFRQQCENAQSLLRTTTKGDGGVLERHAHNLQQPQADCAAALPSLFDYEFCPRNAAAALAKHRSASESDEINGLISITIEDFELADNAEHVSEFLNNQVSATCMSTQLTQADTETATATATINHLDSTIGVDNTAHATQAVSETTTNLINWNNIQNLSPQTNCHTATKHEQHQHHQQHYSLESNRTTPEGPIFNGTVDDEVDFHSNSIANAMSPANNTTNSMEFNEFNLDFTFECKYCYKSKYVIASDEQFATEAELLQHIALQHNIDRPYNCPECSESFQDAASRTVHMRTAHTEKHLECEHCGKKYADLKSLEHHIEKYHNSEDFECSKCSQRFHSRKSLKYHQKWHNPNGQLQCSHCDRLFISRHLLKSHEATHTQIHEERKMEECEHCGKSFKHLKTLRYHIFREHGGEKPCKCRYCPEEFVSYIEKRIHMLEKHLKNLTSIDRTECMICHKRYHDEGELLDHLANEHSQPTQKYQRIPIVIDNNKRVVQDKRQKSYTGIFPCEYQGCTQRFNMKSALEKHMVVHSSEGRPHGCTKCSKRFKRPQDLNWHMKTHATVKSNICDVCGKGFALKYVLTQHKKSHEILEKKFVCEICGRAYFLEKTLRVHKRVHSGKEDYYKCDICGSHFVTHIKLKYHLQKAHADAVIN